MSNRLRTLLALYFAFLLPALFTRPAVAASQSGKRRLAFVLIFTRHGVRAPSALPAKLDRYSVSPWPQWPVPPDYLTGHGYKLLLQFGAWDRQWLTDANLLSASGCHASSIYIYADSEERTIRSGHALAQSLSPSCAVTVHSLPEGTRDPLFHFPPPDLDASARNQVIAAVRGRLPGGMQAFTASHKSQLDLMQSMLDGCKPDISCSPAKKQPGIRVEDAPSEIETGHSHNIVSIKGPVFASASLAEDILLEYAQGMPQNQVAWGLLNTSQLREIIGLHTAEFSIRNRAWILAHMQASNLLDHLLRTLQQAVQGRAVQGAIGMPGDRLVIVDGHDTNIAAVAALLHLHWTLDGRVDDTPPGTQLQFLVFRDAHGHAAIQVRIAMQTLDQMRYAQPLTASNPPALAILGPSHCEMKNRACTWQSFEKIAANAIDRHFVIPLKQ